MYHFVHINVINNHVVIIMVNLIIYVNYNISNYHFIIIFYCY